MEVREQGYVPGGSGGSLRGCRPLLVSRGASAAHKICKRRPGCEVQAVWLDQDRVGDW